MPPRIDQLTTHAHDFEMWLFGMCFFSFEKHSGAIPNIFHDNYLVSLPNNQL